MLLEILHRNSIRNGHYLKNLNFENSKKFKKIQKNSKKVFFSKIHISKNIGPRTLWFAPLRRKY